MTPWKLTVVLLTAHAAVLFHDDFNHSIQTSKKWVFDADDFLWDAASAAPRKHVATHSTSALFATGSTVTAAYAAQNWTLDALGGSFAAALTYAPGALSQMDEDVALVLCNLDPASLSDERWLARERSGGFVFGDACVGGEAADALFGFDVGASFRAPPLDRAWADGSCDARAGADEWGHVAASLELRVAATAAGDVASFDVRFAGCALSLTQALYSSERGGALGVAGPNFDPRRPFWVYVSTDDDQLTFVEISSLELRDARDRVVWRDDFSAGLAGWASPHRDVAGCAGEPAAEAGSLFAVSSGFARVHGSRVALRANATFSGEGVIRASFLVDALNVAVTDSNVAVLLCDRPDIATWDGCYIFSLVDRRGLFAKSAVGPTGVDVDGGACAKRRFLDLEVVVAGGKVIFRDGGNDERQPAAGFDDYCADVSLPFDFAENWYAFAAVDDASGYLTALADFAVHDGPPDGGLRREGGAADHRLAPAACEKRLHAWIWFGTGTCAPNHIDGANLFLGAIGPLDSTGPTCVPVWGEIVHATLVCDEAQVARASVHIGSSCEADESVALFDSARDGDADGGVTSGACYEVALPDWFGLPPSAFCASDGACGSVIVTGDCRDTHPTASPSAAPTRYPPSPSPTPAPTPEPSPAPVPDPTPRPQIAAPSARPSEAPRASPSARSSVRASAE